MKTKLLVWDIEATDLKADWGRLLCIGWKWVGEDYTYISTIRDSNDILDDSIVLYSFEPIMEEADAQITWFGSKYDEPFVKTRGLKHGLDYFAYTPHIDLWKTARYQLRFGSNRLENVGDFFGGSKKTKLDKAIWQRAGIGDTKALEEVEDHCRRDVLETERMYLKMRPYIKNHPNLTVITREMESCPTCGADSSQLRHKGYTSKGLSQYRRWKCTSCGANPLEGPIKEDNKKIVYRTGA